MKYVLIGQEVAKAVASYIATKNNHEGLTWGVTFITPTNGQALSCIVEAIDMKNVKPEGVTMAQS